MYAQDGAGGNPTEKKREENGQRKRAKNVNKEKNRKN